MLRHVVADGLIVALSAALLWNFLNIWIYGQHLIGEPNVLIRSIETAMLLGALCFGIAKLLRSLRGKD